MVRLQPRHHRKACREHVREILERMRCDNFAIHYSQIIDWDNSVGWTPEEEAAEPGRRWCSKNRLMCDYLKGHGDYADFDRTLGLENPRNGSYDTALMGCIQCCIRAALDVAAAPSGGVVGYTVGDLRSMWAPRPLPKWVADFFEPALTTADSAETPVWL